MMKLEIKGLPEVKAYYDRLGATARAFDKMKGQVSSNVPYAFGIETGRKRSGRLARRLGGSWAVRDSQAEANKRTVDYVEQELARARTNQSQPQLAWILTLARDTIRNLLKVRVYDIPIPTGRNGRPKWVRTGRLRDSYQVER